MIQKVSYVAYLKKFSKQLDSILKKIETNRIELDENDREVIRVTIESFVNFERQT